MVRCEVASGIDSAGRHILRDLAGDAAQRLQLLAGPARRGGRRRRGAGAAARRPPLLAARAGLVRKTSFQLSSTVAAVVQILLIQLVFEPAIDTQVRFGFRHWREFFQKSLSQS